MPNIDYNTLRQFSVNGQMVPPEGSRAVPLTLDFTAQVQYTLDLQNFIARNLISMVQAIFVDNSNNASPIEISMPNSGQTLIVPPNAQAYLSVLAPNPASFVFLTMGGVIIDITLLNYPVTNCVWKIS
jgi:hypothetical protein